MLRGRDEKILVTKKLSDKVLIKCSVTSMCGMKVPEHLCFDLDKNGTLSQLI